MKILWNGIVKNESARIARCVESMLPYIDGGVVVDTGSYDNTPALIHKLFAQAGKPVEVHAGEFVSFAQARNLALAKARTSPLPWDYLLLADADMQLVVEDPNWRQQINGGLSYDMRQLAGTLMYWNRRLVSQYTDGIYVCPTHEYLDIPTSGPIHGAYFIDHADGSNRPDKCDRDIKILEDALKTETQAGLIQRMTFYLAQSYFDKGDWAKSAELYKRRVELGGWDEEVWNAQLHYAHCLDNLGDEAGFVRQMLQAYGMRPSRGETLYDLAKWFRLKGMNHVSLLFSETAINTPVSSDQLFVNPWAAAIGSRDEYSICAFYDIRRRDRGAAVVDSLVLGKDIPWESRQQAKANQFWYVRPLVEHVPSFKSDIINFTPPNGYRPMNPSVTFTAYGGLVTLIRTVNYEITPEGRYAIQGSDGTISNDQPINTANFIAALSDDMKIESVSELEMPSRFPPPDYGLVRGFEDSRLFKWRGALYTLSCVRELNPEGWCEQVLAPLDDKPIPRYGNGWEKILVLPQGHEKNWMPWVEDDDLRFVYRLGTLIDRWGNLLVQHEPDIDANQISGGTQVVRVRDRYLAIVHEARQRPDNGLRYYQHRFVEFDRDGSLAKLSRPFVFHDRQIEFAAGLAFILGSQLLVSYGVRDAEAHFGTMDVDDVLRFLG